MSIRGSSIDLGAILGSLIGDSTATKNPMFNANYNDDTEQWEDSEGNALDDKYQKHLNDISDKGGDPYAETKNPYNTPTYTTKIFHPEVAQQEANYNNAWSLQGPSAQHTQDIANNVNANQASLAAPAGTLPANMSPLQKAIFYGNNFTGTNEEAQETAANDIAKGVPAVRSQGNLITNLQSNRNTAANLNNNIPELQSDTAAKNLTAEGEEATNRGLYASGLRKSIPLDTDLHFQMSRGALDRSPLTNTALDLDAGNAVNRAKLESGDLTGSIGRQPTLNASRDVQATNELNNNKLIGQLQGDLALAKINEAHQAALQSKFMPASPSPLVYDSDEKMLKNPYYPGMITTLNAKLGENGTTGGGLSIKPLTKGQATPSPSEQDTAPVNKEVFDEVSHGWSPHQSQIGHDALITSIGKAMNVEPSNIGSSIFTHSLNSTVEEKLKDPEFVKALNNLSPEQLEAIYRNALKAGSNAGE